jgi:hypothetical protein
MDVKRRWPFHTSQAEQQTFYPVLIRNIMTLEGHKAKIEDDPHGNKLISPLSPFETKQDTTPHRRPSSIRTAAGPLKMT